MTEHQRDRGLVRAIGTWGLAASVVNITVGASIFVIPAALASSIGPYAPLAFVFWAFAVGACAICFAEGGSRIPTSGGIYGCIEAAFGPLAGYLAGTMLWLSDALACGGITAVLADIVAGLLAPALRPAAHALVIIGVIGGIALVNIGGIKRGARLVNAATMLKLIPIVVFVVAGAGAVKGTNYLPTIEPNTGDVGRALILALFSFTGMEVSLAASGEIIEPSRTIPRALAIGLLIVTLLYVAIQLICQGILGTALAHSTLPLADAMSHVSPQLRILMIAGAAISMLGWAGTDLLGTPRILFAFARDGLLPRALGRVHARTHAPYVAILSYAALAITLALTGTFAELAVLATLTSAALYIGGCAAGWRLAQRGVAQAGTPLNFRWLGTAAIIGIASMLASIALAARGEILGLVAVLLLSVAAYFLSRRRHAPIGA